VERAVIVCAETLNAEDVLVRLLRETAAGDETAFARLYDATSRRIFGLALRILEKPKLAEEAALEAYWTVWQRAGDYDPRRGAPMTWMLTVARSKSIDMLRAGRRRREKEPLALEPAHTLADDAPSPEAATASAERSARLQAALAKLPAAQRVAIETTYFGGLSYAEAAAVLRAPLGTTKSRIRLGLRALRHQLSEET
jgi:RNA polymerase sigma-70 factor (ECF subfamily)